MSYAPVPPDRESRSLERLECHVTKFINCYLAPLFETKGEGIWFWRPSSSSLAVTHIPSPSISIQKDELLGAQHRTSHRWVASVLRSEDRWSLLLAKLDADNDTATLALYGFSQEKAVDWNATSAARAFVLNVAQFVAGGPADKVFLHLRPPVHPDGPGIPEDDQSFLAGQLLWSFATEPSAF